MSQPERVRGPACFIYNPAAGRGRAQSLGPGLEAAARTLGIEAAVRATTFPGEEIEIGRQARAEGWPLVIAVGGDGTVHGVANGLLSDGPCDCLLGVLPVGTGNDFAYLTGLARGDAAANLRRLLRGEVRRFDVGRALGEYFVNGLGVGFDAEVVRQLATLRLRGFLLYLAAVYKTFWSFRPLRIRVVSPEYTNEDTLMMLEVAIGRRAGGGFRLTPDAEPSDGLFDVCVVRRVTTWQFLRYVPRVIRGTHGRLPVVTMFRCHGLSMYTPDEPLVVHLDGELRLPKERELTVEIVPDALAVICAS